MSAIRKWFYRDKHVNGAAWQPCFLLHGKYTDSALQNGDGVLHEKEHAIETGSEYECYGYVIITGYTYENCTGA